LVWVVLFIIFAWIEFQIHEQTRYAKWIHHRFQSITILGMSLSTLFLFVHSVNFGISFLETLQS